MSGRVRRLLRRVVGRKTTAEGSSEPPEGGSTGAEADGRVSGSGNPIIDDVYGQPRQSRAIDRIDELAREPAYERGIDLDDDRRWPSSRRS